ncbi:MAG: hypothetical protein GF344_16200, partial [Chitinivibrionales bacterium]|nr:hypothetical protein [Chitinivibrionales bacterium]MBD3358234.1 hypothetical protein [Chitinivibrionales bacterium]
MKLLSVLRPECIQIGAKATDKDGVIKEIASIAKRSALLADVDESVLYKSLKDREQIGSTGFGRRIAIPHCALKGLSDFVVGLLIVPRGIDFDALDGEPTKVLAFIVGPSERRNDHIHLLSGISRVINRSDAVDELLSMRKPETARESFLRHVVDKLPTGE